MLQSLEPASNLSLQAGGCLDPAAHVKFGDMVSGGPAKLQDAMSSMVKPANPKAKPRGKSKDAEDKPQALLPPSCLDKAVALQNRVLKEINLCKDCAFRLRPLGLGKELTQQLSACQAKLEKLADKLQEKIKDKCNRNRHYVELIAEAGDGGF